MKVRGDAIFRGSGSLGQLVRFNQTDTRGIRGCGHMDGIGARAKFDQHSCVLAAFCECKSACLSRGSSKHGTLVVITPVVVADHSISPVVKDSELRIAQGAGNAKRRERWPHTAD